MRKNTVEIIWTSFSNTCNYETWLHHLFDGEQVTWCLRIPYLQSANTDNNLEGLWRRSCILCTKHTDTVSGTQGYDNVLMNLSLGFGNKAVPNNKSNHGSLHYDTLSFQKLSVSSTS